VKSLDQESSTQLDVLPDQGSIQWNGSSSSRSDPADAEPAFADILSASVEQQGQDQMRLRLQLRGQTAQALSNAQYFFGVLRGSTQLWDCGIGISAIGEQVFSWAGSIWFATVAVPCQAETYLDLTRARVTHEQGSTLLENGGGGNCASATPGYL
jgi:hypothetical protein